MKGKLVSTGLAQTTPKGANLELKGSAPASFTAPLHREVKEADLLASESQLALYIEDDRDKALRKLSGKRKKGSLFQAQNWL